MKHAGTNVPMAINTRLVFFLESLFEACSLSLAMLKVVIEKAHAMYGIDETSPLDLRSKWCTSLR